MSKWGVTQNCVGLLSVPSQEQNCRDCAEEIRALMESHSLRPKTKPRARQAHGAAAAPHPKRCDLCEAGISSLRGALQHLRGSKHLQKLCEGRPQVVKLLRPKGGDDGEGQKKEEEKEEEGQKKEEEKEEEGSVCVPPGGCCFSALEELLRMPDIQVLHEELGFRAGGMRFFFSPLGMPPVGMILRMNTFRPTSLAANGLPQVLSVEVPSSRPSPWSSRGRSG